VPSGQRVIGWREYVDLPELGIRQVKAKSDTGARTSALDVRNVVELGGNRVRFDVVRSRREDGRVVTAEADIVRRTRIKSSFGQAHDRLVIPTKLRIGPVEKDVELGLVSRRKMLCRVLLGRKALEGDFLVDARHTYLYGRRKRKTQADAPPLPGAGAGGSDPS